MPALVLASTSPTRALLLRNAGLEFTAVAPRVDEQAIKATLQAESTSPRDIADALAEAKALKVSARSPGAFVIGCDQTLDLDGECWDKPPSPDDARDQLSRLRGRDHRLHAACVIALDGVPQWRAVGSVRMVMRDYSDDFLTGYIQRNWPAIGGSVGAYLIEGEGIRLFSRIEGDYFSVLGLPLLDLLSYLTTRQVIQP
jgi:septum formation protein